MNLVELILKVLKTKAKDLGFNEGELQSVAAVCAGNLTVTEETEETERDAAINDMVDKVAIPLLKSSQSVASRTIAAYKKAHPVTDRTKPGEEDEDADDPSKKKPGAGKETDEMPAWAKAMKESIDKLTEENASMKAERASTSRKERLVELTKGTGRFGENIVKGFDRMTFKDDADFDAYFDSVKTEVEGYKQDLANHGLESLGNPPAVDHKDDPKKLDQSVIDQMGDMV